MSEAEANLNQVLKVLEQFGPQELAVIEERLAARKQNSGQPPDTAGVFDLLFDDYLVMSDEERDAIAFRAYQTLGAWIDAELKKQKAEWILVCGGEVIESSPTLRNYPSREKLMQIGQQRGLVPFVFVKAPLIEESGWSALAGDDFYPITYSTHEVMKMRKVMMISAVAVFIAAICLFTLPATNANSDNKPAAKSVTFTKDVAPIFFKQCAECHREGEVAPFSVMSYKDVRPWAKSIREKVVSKEMPPWHADPNHGQWLNDRRLTQAEIDTITAWVDGGAKEGAPLALPPAPKFIDGWAIGKPDETFSIPEQSVPATGVIKYQYFDVATNFKEDRWITAAEIRSTGRAAVHHVIVFISDPNSSARGDGNLLAGFAPGEQPTRFRPGMAKKVPAGSKLRFQMHYTPNGAATKDVTTIGVIYAKETPKHQVLTRPVLNTGFVIPAGAPSHEVKSFHTFREDTSIVSFMPHMHLRGKDFEIKAIYPDGTSKILLNVPKYDFNWQTYYVPKEAVALPKGTKIECTAHFDNSTNNKYNPDPTKDVRWGDQTWEEMMIGWLSYYSPKPADKPEASTSSSSGAQK